MKGVTYTTQIGHENKELLEGTGVKSAYGFPPVYIETPQVLKRIQPEIPEEAKDKLKMTSFAYGDEELETFTVLINTTTLNVPPQQATPQTGGDSNTETEPAFDLAQVSNETLKELEAKGASNITVKQDQFITPNAAEGLKTHGSLTYESEQISYSLFGFTTQNILQQIMITWPEEDTYADEMVERIIASIELKPLTEDDKE